MSRTDELIGPVWATIVHDVEAGLPLTYTHLAAAVGSHRQSPALHGTLALIQEQCLKRGWPDLSAAVVGAGSGVPGVGRLGRRETREQWSQEWATVRHFPWPASPPSVTGSAPR